jgi:NTE family protein
VVGTSAGSVVGAQVAAGLDLEELFAAQVAGYGSEVAARVGARILLGLGWAMVRSRRSRAYRARIGRMALAARTVRRRRRCLVRPAAQPPPARVAGADSATTGGGVSGATRSGAGRPRR